MTPTEADEIRQTYNTRIEELRGRKDLSEEGRRRQMAKAKLEADAKFRAIREKESTDRDARRDSLVKRLFGSEASVSDGAQLLAVRDALNRADDAKSPADARKLLRLARMSGDETLARATAARAYQGIRGSLGGARESWGAVLNEFAAGDPVTLERVGELLEIDAVGESRGRVLTQQLLGQMRAHATTPPELKSADNIDGLAQDADLEEDEPKPAWQVW
jgi:hypothetical protein